MKTSGRKFLQQAALAGTGLTFATTAGLLAVEKETENNNTQFYHISFQ